MQRNSRGLRTGKGRKQRNAKCARNSLKTCVQSAERAAHSLSLPRLVKAMALICRWRAASYADEDPLLVLALTVSGNDSSGEYRDEALFVQRQAPS
jgi:hypothetical protein